MARSNLSDFLQVYAFWLMDVHPIEGYGLPIFNPLAGFNTITAPSLEIEISEIYQGNWHYPTRVVKGARASEITLTRGVTFFDSDFWRWTLAAVTGNTENFRLGLLPQLPIGGPSPRRRLVLIHFFTHTPVNSLLNAATALVTGGLVEDAPVAVRSVNPFSGKVRTRPARVGVGPFEFIERVPAKAWFLHECIPIRFKSGGDFDARSGEISIAELDIAPDWIEEISLASS